MATNLLSVQYLRAIAAIIVVYFHTKVYLPDAAFDLPRRFGFAGVDIFFVVSGFIIYVVTFSGRDSVPRYFLKRIIRVVPLYWGATLAALALFVAAPSAFIKQSTSAAHVVMSLLFLPYPSPDGDGSAPFLKIGWTLNFEMYFYTVFGVALLVRNKVLRLLLLFVFFAVSVAYGVLFGADGAMLGYYTNPIVMEFLFGAVLGALYVGGYLKRITVAQSVAIAVVATAFILPSFDFGTTTAGRVIVLGIPAAFLLLALVSLEQNGRLPRLPVLAALGDASYSIYLAHPFALTAAKLAVRSLELAADNAAIGMLVVATSVVFALGFGYLTHRLIELPMLEGLRRLLLSDREAATAGERRSAVVN